MGAVESPPDPDAPKSPVNPRPLSARSPLRITIDTSTPSSKTPASSSSSSSAAKPKLRRSYASTTTTGRRLRDAEKAGIRAAAEYEAAHPGRAKARAEAWAASTQPPGPRTPAPSPVAFSPSSSSSFSSAPSAAEKALEDLAAAYERLMEEEKERARRAEEEKKAAEERQRVALDHLDSANRALSAARQTRTPGKPSTGAGRGSISSLVSSPSQPGQRP